MKKILLFLLAFIACEYLHSQNVGIGTNTPNASAQLDITSTTKGVLIPRMTEIEKAAIAAPAPGLLIFNTTSNSFQYYNGSAWINITHSGIVNGSPNRIPRFAGLWGLGNGMMIDDGNGVSVNSGANPDPSAVMDIQSTTKGILIPRMTTGQRTAILAPQKGLLVFDNTTSSFWFYNGTAWTNLNAGGSASWESSGNNIYNSNSGNVGIGTAEPLNKLQVAGNLVISSPVSLTNTPPTPGQTITMVNATTLHTSLMDSTYRVYDPGGPAGNYLPNLLATLSVDNFSAIAYELTVEVMDLGTGDSLIIREGIGNGNILLAVGNGYTTTGKYILNFSSLVITFKSNADASVGAGFSLLLKRLYDASSSLPNIAGITSNGFYYDAKKRALRAGAINNSTVGQNSIALGPGATATEQYAVAIGVARAIGFGAAAYGFDNEASGIFSSSMGSSSEASGDYSTTLGYGTVSRGYGGTAVGMYNNPVLASAQTSPTSVTPVFMVGNGNGNVSRSNAMIVLKNGNIGIGKDVPAANLHILHTGGGGLILENANNNNKWRLYSASGDNNLTFYNNAGNEVADIDDITGTYSAISDGRLKKNIQHLPSILPLLLQLAPSYYQFNWQKDDQRQLGLIAQEAYRLFPELVSYDKEKDIYKMNYAGFSVVAIKAIQEQQKEIEELKIRLEKLETILKNK